MSDFDRGKRRKKRISTAPLSGGDKEEEVDNAAPLVILSKPHQEPAHQSDISDRKSPTVLLKMHQKHDTEGNRSTTATGQLSGTQTESASSGTTPVYQLQQKQPVTGQSSSGGHAADGLNLEQKLSPPPEMLDPVKLIDESFQWCDYAMEFLQDQNDFYVVGVLGLQGSGKSTVMSLLARQRIEDGYQLFKPQTEELKELGAHCTIGVDMYITSERVILLDTQPVLSASVMDRIIQYEKKTVGGPDYTSTENALQMQSLQVAAFLMAVCHTIVLVQDWFCDSNLLRFVQAAEMLKPATPTNPHDLGGLAEDMLEYYPNLVFVQNRCQPSYYSPSAISKMEATLSCIFGKSRLRCWGSIHMDQCLERKFDISHDCINFFLLPEKDNSEMDLTIPEYQGHEGFVELANTLTYQILSMPKTLLTRSSLTEKNWFHYTARIWEAVKKSNLFLEYNRLLP